MNKEYEQLLIVSSPLLSILSSVYFLLIIIYYLHIRISRREQHPSICSWKKRRVILDIPAGVEASTMAYTTVMAIPFSGSARKVESSAMVHPSFTSVSLLFTVSFILYQFMNLLVNTKSCFLTGWYEVRSNNPFGGTNRIRFTGYNLSPSAVYVGPKRLIS